MWFLDNSAKCDMAIA